MTSFAFIAGVVPLVLATGAGAEMRHAMSIAVLPACWASRSCRRPVIDACILRGGSQDGIKRENRVDSHDQQHNDGNGIMKITFTGYRQAATLATLAFVTTLAGCTIAPNTKRPASPTAMVYPYATSTVSGAPDAADIESWRDFSRRATTGTDRDRVRNNRDLRRQGSSC